MSSEERGTIYKCTILDFSLAHKFAPETPPRQAFHMQDLALLVRVGFNKKAHKPPVSAIKDKYYELYRGTKGEHEAEGEAGPSS